MTAVTDFVTYIRPNVSGCPDVLIKREVVQAAIKLCTESFLWREQTDPHPIIKGIREYSIDLPVEDADPVQLESLTINGRALTATTIESLDEKQYGWRQAKGEPTQYFHRNSHSEIMFNREPNKTEVQAMVCSFALKPMRTATTLPDFLYTDWLEAIESGALSRLLVMPNKEWSNGELGLYHKVEWEKQLSEARMQVNLQWSDGPLRATGNKVMSNKINLL